MGQDERLDDMAREVDRPQPGLIVERANLADRLLDLATKNASGSDRGNAMLEMMADFGMETEGDPEVDLATLRAWAGPRGGARITDLQAAIEVLAEDEEDDDQGD